MPGVTIALWGGLLADDPSRRDREQTWRRERVVASLVDDLTIEAATAEAVWAHAVTTFRTAWRDEHHTVGIARALGEGLAAQGLRPGPGFELLVSELETRALDDAPHPLPGAVEAVRTLAERWPVGVLCDVRVTPAPVLRDVLESIGIAPHLDAAIFSDEVGAARPAREVFRVASRELGVPLEALVHAGPSEARDVLGAQAAGARAVRIGEPPSVAEACCDGLPGLFAAVEAVIAS